MHNTMDPREIITMVREAKSIGKKVGDVKRIGKNVYGYAKRGIGKLKI